MCNAVHYCRTTLYAWLASSDYCRTDNFLLWICWIIACMLQIIRILYTYATAAIFIIHIACIPYTCEIIVMLNSVCSMVTVRMWWHAVHDNRWSIFGMMYMWVYR